MDYLYSPPDFQLAEICAVLQNVCDGKFIWTSVTDWLFVSRWRFVYSILGEQVRGFTRLAKSAQVDDVVHVHGF